MERQEKVNPSHHNERNRATMSSVSQPSTKLKGSGSMHFDPNAAKKPDSPKESTGGYVDRPWIPRFWDGMIASAWFRLLWQNRLWIAPQRWAMAVIISVISVMNSVLGLVQSLTWGKRIARTAIGEEEGGLGDPIFVIGHWRSGTTLLHELLVLDKRFTFPNTYDCFAPNHFLVSAAIFRPLLSILLPKQRPMDNMAAGWDRPQEDEFALCNMGLPSPYLTCAFPNHPPQSQEYYDLRQLSAGDRSRWQQKLKWFLQCLTVRTPKRVVLKSPPHTFRIPVLLEMFPKARFVHIVRNPSVLFPSTVNLWKRLYRNEGLQVPTYAGLEEHVLNTFQQMYEAFERDRATIPAGQLCEVRYEDLTVNTVEQMENIYKELGLAEFDQVRPNLESYVAAQADYKTNKYNKLDPQWSGEIRRRWSSYFERYGYPLDET
jgi:hypothetical protein